MSRGLAQRSWSHVDVALLTALLFLGGIGMVFRSASGFAQSHLGIDGPFLAILFLLYCFAIVTIAKWLFMGSSQSALRTFIAIGTLALSALFAIAVTLFIPESIDQHADRDDALDIAGRQLWHGLDPWAVPTQLGPEQHPSPFLGGILLALPFVIVLGSSAIQSIFWFLCGGWLAIRDLGLMRTAAFALLLVSSPIFINEIVFQSDLWVNTVVIVIATLWGFRSFASTPVSRWGVWLSAILLALAMADRFIFWPLMIPIAGLILTTHRTRSAWMWLIGVTLLAGGLTTIPWLIFPESLEQTLRNVSKASSDAIPHSGVILVCIMVVIAVVGTVKSRSLPAFFTTMAVTMLAVPLWQAIQASLESESLSFNGYTVVAYSAAFLILGIVAALLPRGGQRLPLIPASGQSKSSKP